MKKITAFAICYFLLVLNVQAQTFETRGLIYNHEMSGGLLIHTAGWSLFLDLAKREEYRKKNLWEFEITQTHHPKEIKQTIDFGLTFYGFNSPKPFFYGKQNSFYNINVSYGKQFLLAEKAEKRGVEVGIKLLGGLSLGVLKPYYINALYSSDVHNDYGITAIRYTPETAEKFLDWFSIYGASGVFYGFDHMSVVPGIHLKGGFNFDWAGEEQSLKALEVGIVFDAY
ncbi:MAG: hypothetical protein LH473_09160, partial [Chitinophagales bacterium]|nr:hypothetical protein [Chitinophagales bacterium]